MSTTSTDAAPVRATVLGYPRIGRRRELKRATEAYWAGTLSAAELLAAGERLRGEHWQAQRDAGIDQVPCNDFSFYDAMLDAVVLVGAVPPRFRRPLRAVDAVPEEEQALHEYFAMARGTDTTPPLEMTSCARPAASRSARSVSTASSPIGSRSSGSPPASVTAAASAGPFAS